MSSGVGDPIPYRVALPEEAEIEAKPGLLSARTWELSVVVVALDVMADEEPLPVPVSRFGSRRVFTSMVMGSDSVLFELMEEELRTRKLQLEDVVRGTGVLGEQRAGRLRGRFDDRGAEAWLEMYATAKNGVLYMLSFAVLRGVLDPHDPLLARIHRSFVLPQ